MISELLKSELVALLQQQVTAIAKEEASDLTPFLTTLAKATITAVETGDAKMAVSIRGQLKLLAQLEAIRAPSHFFEIAEAVLTLIVAVVMQQIGVKL